MSMLIIGGLFAIALLAIIGLVVLIANDRTTPQTRQVNRAAVQATQEAAAPAGAPQHVTGSEHTAASERASRTVAGTETLLEMPVMDEQFYELSAQIRILYQQVQDMEHRLKALIELTERFERAASPTYQTLDEKLPMTPLSIE